jgi:hypothetical protein
MTSGARVILFAAALARSSSAAGTDIAFGGDAILSQLRNAQVVAVARLQSKGPQGFAFTRVESLKGDVPATFTVPANDTYLQGLSVRPGATYLLYLKPGAQGPLTLATSIYSMQQIPQGQSSAVTEAVKTYLRDMNDKAALKTSLLRLAGTPAAYVQYSAVADLKNLHAIAAEELGQLVQLTTAGRLTDARAKGIIVREAGRLKAAGHSSFLEQRVTDPSETVGVKADALEALYQMNAMDSLRRVAPAVDRSGSLRLKNQLRLLLERR